jgi:hypothetical protein
VSLQDVLRDAEIRGEVLASILANAEQSELEAAESRKLANYLRKIGKP